MSPHQHVQAQSALQCLTELASAPAGQPVCAEQHDRAAAQAAAGVRCAGRPAAGHPRKPGGRHRRRDWIRQDHAGENCCAAASCSAHIVQRNEGKLTALAVIVGNPVETPPGQSLMPLMTKHTNIYTDT